MYQRLSTKKPANGKSRSVGNRQQTHLKAGVKNISGSSLDDVKVHYNSSKGYKGGAYAQGTNLEPGHEKHVPHEGWHVVQQRPGRVKPTRWSS